MRALWCRQAWIGGQLHEGVRAEYDDDGIVRALATDTQPRQTDEKFSGVVFPAASNAHSHAFHRVLRGRTHSQSGSFWTWRREMYRAAQTLTPRLYEDLATAAYAEMVVAGWTSVAEFHYLHHRPDGSPYSAADPASANDDGPHAMERALARAAVSAGIRLTLLDTCYLSAGFGAPVQREQVRFSDKTAEQWLGRLESLREAFANEFHPASVSVGAAIHSVRAVDEEALAVISRELPPELPLHIHLSEQPDENRECLTATGLTPTGLLAKHGLLSDRLTVVHATHLTGDDIRLLGAEGVTVAMCPTTEADLADGIGPAWNLRDAGARLALGTDQHAVVDPWLEMRALEHGQRLATGERGRFSPPELVGIAADGGAAAQGRTAPGLGIGQPCDLVELDPQTLRTAGAQPGQFPLVATAQDVTAVVVGGRVAARRGRHSLLGDPAQLLVKAIHELDALRVEGAEVEATP